MAGPDRTSPLFEPTPGTTVVNSGFEEVTSRAPVLHGEMSRAQPEVVAVRASSSRPDQGIVSSGHRAHDQRNVLVARCRRAALMGRRPA